MLDQLDSIPWGSLSHAYGSASDVPDQIRALRSSDRKSREKALYDLYGNIFHQGTRYKATPYAIPFLYELVNDRKTPAREDIIYYLVNLALGYEESFLPDGIDWDIFSRQLRDADSQLSISEREQCEKYGYGPKNDLNCYLAVEAGAPVLAQLLDDSNSEIRKAATYCLAWFPRCATEVLTRIQHSLASESDDAGLANAILAIGLLARSSHQTELTALTPFLTHASLLVRTASAIALASAPLSEGVIDVLIEAIMSPEQIQDLGTRIHFNEGNLAGYASLVLARSGENAKTKVVLALCESLKKVNASQAMDITRALLDLTVDVNSTPIKERPASSLEPLQLIALRSIAENGGWKINGGIYVNYYSLMHEYGLPDSQEELLKYVGIK